jgi:SAM-dependent methyltransferase
MIKPEAVLKRRIRSHAVSSICFAIAFSVVGLLLACPAGARVLTEPDDSLHSQLAAERFTRQARSVLAPVYPYLAEHIVSTFGLADRPGVGIDLGSGPGSLVVELAKRTDSLYWINADINPHFFGPFLSAAAEAGVSHRVGAVFADAQKLPFRDNYADIIVSRGSFHFWEDRIAAFGEIYRVLKPGGVAFIGRGLAGSMPVGAAGSVRNAQKGGPRYDLKKTAAELSAAMDQLGIDRHRIATPHRYSGVNYGIWLTFHKPGP